MSETVISVENLSKAYRLGVINHGMLYKDIQSWWARKRGKEDPNAKLDMYNKDQIDGEDRFWALRDISFEVKQGDRIGIIGKNGAGKSTLLKILSRVTAPTTGNVKVKGRIASLLEVGTGFHPELTGRENIYLNGAILGMTKNEIQEKFDEIVDFAGIEKFIDTPVKRYSSGMYVRLAFAVAAHLEPEILVVDEVLAVGDAEFQKKAIGKMEDVSKGEGRTVLFVSHNMSAIVQLCTKALLLESGLLIKNCYVNDAVDYYLNRFTDYNIFNATGAKRLNDVTNINIKDLKITDSKATTFSPLEFTFSIESKNKDVVKGIELAIGISSITKVPLLQLYSSHMGKRFSIKPGINTIKVKIKSIPLTPGVYSCNLWLGKGQVPIDWIQDCFILNVEASKESKGYIENRGYPIILESFWDYN